MLLENFVRSLRTRNYNKKYPVAFSETMFLSSRSKIDLLRLPDGTNHSYLKHFGGNNSNRGNHLTMLKAKVWYHSQRNVQESSV